MTLGRKSSSKLRPFWIVVLTLIAYDTVSSSTSDSSSHVVVKSPAGAIRGRKELDDGTGQHYVTFLGIPYAKPPLGELRFSKPEPLPKFDDEFDATKTDRIACPAPDFISPDRSSYTENCLVLNVHSNSKYTDRQDKKPLNKVLVFIHGGAFVYNSGYDYDPKSFVLGQDIIVVTINYRLGVLGFLSTDDNAGPGNYGLWDQIMALKWVKNNIRAFGGDPSDVTIAGESAGGASVALLSITPHTRGLFTKVYQQSGSATSVFANYRKARQDMEAVAKDAGCWRDGFDNVANLENSRVIMNCLRKAPVSVFTRLSDISLEYPAFVPRVDEDLIPNNPSELLTNFAYLDSLGFYDRKYLIGMNNAETNPVDSSLKMSELKIISIDNISDNKKDAALQSFYMKAKHHCLVSRFGENKASDQDIFFAANDYYGRRFSDNRTQVLQFSKDLNFIIPSLDFAQAVSKHESGSAHVFYFNYFPSFMKGILRGVPHALDLAYWFDKNLTAMSSAKAIGVDGDFEEEDNALKRSLSSIVGHLARNGNPADGIQNLPGGWPRFRYPDGHYLEFNSRPWTGTFFQKSLTDLWFETLPAMATKSCPAHTEL